MNFVRADWSEFIFVIIFIIVMLVSNLKRLLVDEPVKKRQGQLGQPQPPRPRQKPNPEAEMEQFLRELGVKRKEQGQEGSTQRRVPPPVEPARPRSFESRLPSSQPVRRPPTPEPRRPQRAPSQAPIPPMPPPKDESIGSRRMVNSIEARKTEQFQSRVQAEHLEVTVPERMVTALTNRPGSGVSVGKLDAPPSALPIRALLANKSLLAASLIVGQVLGEPVGWRRP